MGLVWWPMATVKGKRRENSSREPGELYRIEVGAAVTWY